MSDTLKNLIDSAAASYEVDKNNPVYKAVREIIGVEKQYHYDANSDNRRLKRIREIIHEEAKSRTILDGANKESEQ